MIGIRKSILITIAAVLSICLSACGKKESPPKEQSRYDMSRTVKVKIETSNTDLIKDEATISLIDSENVIATYLELFPDGRIDDDRIELHPNEDYIMVIKYNGVNEKKEFHTGENDGQYYTLSLDYAKGEFVFSHDEDWRDILDSGEFRYYVNDDGSVTIFGWDGADEEVVIPEKIDGRTVTKIEDLVFCYCKDLKSVEIPDSVTTIGNDTFRKCENLTSIKLPASLTTIGEQAFSECKKLTGIDFPASLTTIGESAFFFCKGLTRIKMPASLTTIEKGAFHWCDGLTNVEIPDSVTMIGEAAFSGCRNLESIDLPASLTTIMRNPFCYNPSLIRIDVSPDNEVFEVIDNVLINKIEKTLVCYPGGLSQSEYIVPEGVQSIGEAAFEGQYALTEIRMPDTLTTIKPVAFENCQNLTDIELPDSVTTIGNLAFFGCEGLESIDIPASVTTIGEMAFENCKDLKSINIPDAVTIIGDNAFKNCDNVTLVVGRDSYAAKYAEENGLQFTERQEKQ